MHIEFLIEDQSGKKAMEILIPKILADAVYRGGHQALKNKGGQTVGQEKSIWAEKISPHMNLDENKSPSFQEMFTQFKNLHSNNYKS